MLHSDTSSDEEDDTASSDIFTLITLSLQLLGKLNDGAGLSSHRTQAATGKGNRLCEHTCTELEEYDLVLHSVGENIVPTSFKILFSLSGENNNSLQLY